MYPLLHKIQETTEVHKEKGKSSYQFIMHDINSLQKIVHSTDKSSEDPSPKFRTRIMVQLQTGIKLLKSN